MVSNKRLRVTIQFIVGDKNEASIFQLFPLSPDRDRKSARTETNKQKIAIMKPL